MACISHVLSGLIIIIFSRRTEKLYAYALDRTEVCLHTNFKFIGAMIVSSMFSKEEDEEHGKYCFIPQAGDISSNFFACIYM